MNSPCPVFGPVPSRRLGLSLGIDIIPPKTCTLDCVYCELGPTDKRALRRKEYIPGEYVLAEARRALQGVHHIDAITFSGSGEPTLNSALGRMIRSLKQITDIPIAVITNGTLLSLPEVREDLLDADFVLPSLNACTDRVFDAIGRPHPQLHLDQILEGLLAFRRDFRGQLWVEIVLVKGINDGKEELDGLRAFLREVRPEKIQLNTVVRPPAVPTASPVDAETLQKICNFFGPPCEIIGPVTSSLGTSTEMERAHLLAILTRRPMTLTELGLSIDAPLASLQAMVRNLQDEELVHSFDFQGRQYFEALASRTNVDLAGR